MFHTVGSMETGAGVGKFRKVAVKATVPTMARAIGPVCHFCGPVFYMSPPFEPFSSF